MMDKNNAGIALGLLFAIAHAVWSFLIAVIPSQLQAFLDWVLGIHALTPYLQITEFSFINAVILVIVTFVFGYIFGWVFAWAHNLVHKKR